MSNIVVNTTYCREMVQRFNVTVEQGLTPSVELFETLLLVIGFGIFATLVAVLFVFIRSRVYKDKNSLDTAFDAGGHVSVGLTATTVVSQWTWAAALLVSCTYASRAGISGPFWFAAGASFQIMMFAMVSVQMKIRAPGAKTFLQVIKARFGKSTHKVFVIYALLTNTFVTANSMLGGVAVLSGLTKDMSVEYATMLMAAVIGTYTFIGGLGATFYVSFFNTAMVFCMTLVFITKVFDDENNLDNPLGSIRTVYGVLSCSEGPPGNEGDSYLTMLSYPGLMYGLITVSNAFGSSYVDQSYWQSSVAAKPKQGVMGFIAAGLVWFAVPFALATNMGLGYIALSTRQNTSLLADEEVNLGLVLPVVSQRLFGKSGEIMILIMVMMAVVSTGSAEVVAVASIIVYDIYQLYLKPFRLVHDANSCILCGKGRGRKAGGRDKCTCISIKFCSNCLKDDTQRLVCKRAIKPGYQCRMHGSFREYTDYLSQLKNWCLLWTTLAIVPLTIALYTVKINLTFLHLSLGVLVNSAVIPITLCMFWERLTGSAMVTGSVGGTVVAIISWLSVTASLPGGLVSEISSLVGNTASLVVGGIITVLVSMFFGRNKDGDEVWEKTRDIDNPLSPWTELYEKDLNLTGAYRLDNRPQLKDVQRVFRRAKHIALVVSISLAIVMVVVWPLIMIASPVLPLSTFSHWVTVSKVWAFLAAIFIIVAPFFSEIWDIYAAHRRNRVSELPPELSDNDNARPENSRQSQTGETANAKTELSITITLSLGIVASHRQVTVSKVWAFLAAIFIIVAPFFSEIWDIYAAHRRNRVSELPPELSDNDNARPENSRQSQTGETANATDRTVYNDNAKPGNSRQSQTGETANATDRTV